MITERLLDVPSAPATSLGKPAQPAVAGPEIGPEALPLPEALTGWMGFLLSKTERRAHKAMEAALALLGMRPRHYAVLLVLATGEPLSQQALGAQLRIDRTTVVMIVDDLERLGCVARRLDLADRRAYRLELTVRGEAMLERINGALPALEDELLAPLSLSERGQLRSLLRRVCGVGAPSDTAKGFEHA